MGWRLLAARVTPIGVVMIDRVETLVLGGGLVGLGAGLAEPTVPIYESKGYVGGHAHSRPLGAFHFDEGAHIIHSRSDWFLDLVDEGYPAAHVMDGSTVRNY